MVFKVQRNSDKDIRIRNELSRLEADLERDAQLSPLTWSLHLQVCTTILEKFSQHAAAGPMAVEHYQERMGISPNRLVREMKSISEKIGSAIKDYQHRDLNLGSVATVKSAFENAAMAALKWKVARNYSVTEVALSGMNKAITLTQKNPAEAALQNLRLHKSRRTEYPA